MNHSNGRESTRQAIPTETYRRHLSRARDTSRQVHIPENLFLIMSKTEAMFLQKLIQVEQSYGAILDATGYFMCTGTFLSNAHWTKNESDHFFQLLRHRGFIKTKRAASPITGHQNVACRWVFIEYEAIEEVLDRATQNVICTHNDAYIQPLKKDSKESFKDRRRKRTRKPRTAAPTISEIEERHDMNEPALFPDKEIKSNILEQDKERASRLRKYVQSRGWFVARQTKLWAAAFSKLRPMIKEEKLIDTVLDFYTANKLSKPAVRNGEEFMNRWTWLYDLYQKHQASHPAQKLDKQAQEVSTRLLKQYHWPKGCEGGVPALVQISMDNVRAFRSAVDAIDVYSPKQYLYGFCRRVIAESGPTYTVQTWCEKLVKRLAAWADWSGNLSSWVWAIDHKDVQAWGNNLSVGYSGTTAMWKKLMEEISGDN